MARPCRFLFRTDFLETSLGDYGYEPYDTKLARTAKVSALVQLADYASQLEAIQSVRPERVHLVLGDKSQVSFRTDDIAGCHRRARTRVQAATRQSLTTYPEPATHCAVCNWHERCNEQREADDHLTHVYGVRRKQIKTLRAAGIATVAELANASHSQKPARMVETTWARIQSQAKLQNSADGENHS